MAYDSETIVQGALKKAGEQPNNKSKFFSSAYEHLNRCYKAILSGSNEFDIDMGEPWSWALSSSPKVFILKAPYSTGNITVTNGSSTASFGTPPSDSKAGWYLKFDSIADYYKIISHTAGGTGIVLDCEYTDASDTLGFECHKLEYDMSNVLRLATSFNICKNQNIYSENRGKIYGCEYRVLRDSYPISKLIKGAPDRFAEIKETDTSIKNLKVLFNASVVEDTRVEIDYIPYPSDFSSSSTGYTVIPERFREVLEFATAFYLLTEKKDGQAADYLALTQRKLKSMLGDKIKTIELVSRNKGRLLPRQDMIRNAARRY